MALSEDLPLYRDTYRLLNNLLVLTQEFPRFFRYSMGSRMVDLTLDMLSLIYKANSSYEKVGVLAEFLDRYRMLTRLRADARRGVRQHGQFLFKHDARGQGVVEGRLF